MTKESQLFLSFKVIATKVKLCYGEQSYSCCVAAHTALYPVHQSIFAKKDKGVDQNKSALNTARALRPP